MKKLLIGLLLGICATGAEAITYQSVRASTATVLTPTIQVGAMNLSSGTITNINSTNENVANTLTAKYLTVTSTASFVGVSGSTVTYSSATFTNMNVTGTGTIATLNTSNGNVTLTTAAITGISGSTITYSSATFTGAHVTGAATVDGALTAGSLTTTGTSSLTGTTTLGGAGKTVTISSNAIVGNTTFYPDAPIAAGSINLSGTITFAGGSTQTVSGQFGRLVQVKCSTTTSATTSSGTGYTLTTSSVTINMKNASDMVKVTMMGIFGNSAVSTVGAFASLMKNTVDTSIGGTGYCGIDGTVVGAVRAPCTMVYFDYPGTVAGTAYAVYIKSSTGASATWNADTVNAFACVEEYTPPNNQ